MKVWVDFLFFNKLETKQHLTSGRRKKCSIMHSHWTNKRDIKLQFYALKRFETGRFLLFSVHPNPLCLLPKIPPACQPPLSLARCLHVDGMHHFVWLHRDEPEMKCVTRYVYSTNNRRVKKKKGDGSDVKGNGSRGRHKQMQGESQGWRAKVGKKESLGMSLLG